MSIPQRITATYNRDGYHWYSRTMKAQVTKSTKMDRNFRPFHYEIRNGKKVRISESLFHRMLQSGRAIEVPYNN